MTENMLIENENLRIRPDIKTKIKKVNSENWLYKTCTVIAISVTLSLLAFVGFETIKQTDKRIVVGAESDSIKSENSINFKKVLDDKLNGESVNSCIEKLDSNKSDINVQRMIMAFKTFQTLNEFVVKKKDIKYVDLRLKIKTFLDEVRSNYRINSDTLYFGYMARDIIFYIFNNENIFLIHDNDLTLVGSDGKSLKAFYEDATTVYNFLKEIISTKINDIDGFFKDSDNANLFLIAMYCKARYVTVGRNDETEMKYIIQSLESNRFTITGPTREKLDWIKNDLKMIENRSDRYSLKRNRPNFIAPIWLK